MVLFSFLLCPSGGLSALSGKYPGRPRCRLELKPVAVILNDKELVRLLTHLGFYVEFPRFRPAAQASLYKHACGPPDEQCQLDLRVDYEAIEPAPADD